MNFQEFFDAAHRLEVKLDVSTQPNSGSILLSNEALFHLPLLAMIILTLSKGRRKPKFDELGQVVGECIEKTLAGYKGSSQFISWSANLRIRTIKALMFLEAAKLVDVNQDNKYITATELGKRVIQMAIDGDTNLAITLSTIQRSYRDFMVERQIRLEVS
jgi:hypothetical protein